MKGMQAAGIANIVNSTSYGTQAGGHHQHQPQGHQGQPDRGHMQYHL
jgi:hypothetical protein